MKGTRYKEGREVFKVGICTLLHCKKHCSSVGDQDRGEGKDSLGRRNWESSVLVRSRSLHLSPGICIQVNCAALTALHLKQSVAAPDIP